jgi:hypothetical protein
VPRKKTDWENLLLVVNEGVRKLNRKPRYMRNSCWMNPGSILQAYREGDLTFHQAVKALKKWKKLP